MRAKLERSDHAGESGEARRHPVERSLNSANLCPRRQVEIPGGILLGILRRVEAVALRQRLSEAKTNRGVRDPLDAALVDLAVRAHPDQRFFNCNGGPAPMSAASRRNVELAVDDHIPDTE